MRLGMPSWVFLTALLIAVTFYIGLSTDFLAFTRGAQQLLYAFSGRDASGRPVNYPTGATGSYQDPFAPR